MGSFVDTIRQLLWDHASNADEFIPKYKIITEYQQEIEKGIFIATAVKTQFDRFLTYLDKEWASKRSFLPLLDASRAFHDELAVVAKRQLELYLEVSSMVTSLAFVSEETQKLLKMQLNLNNVLTVEFNILNLVYRLKHAIDTDNRVSLHCTLRDMTSEISKLHDHSLPSVRELQIALKELHTVSAVEMEGPDNMAVSSHAIRETLNVAMCLAEQYIESWGASCSLDQ